MGPYQPVGPHKKTTSQLRSFVQSWFDQFDGLEYSVAKNAAFCLYCYLFKPQKTSNFGNDALAKVGFKNWNKGKDSFMEHAQAIDGFHSNVRKGAIDFKSQRQSVEHVWTVTSVAEHEAYKAHLTKILKRLQGLRIYKINLPHEGSRCVLY
jgi:hypothetical protein